MVALAERPHERSRQSLLLATVLFIVLFELAIYFQHAANTGDFSVSTEARRRQHNYDDCVARYLELKGDTPGNRAIAHGLCFINFLI